MINLEKEEYAVKHNSRTYFGYDSELVKVLSNLKDDDIVLITQEEQTPIYGFDNEVSDIVNTITTGAITWDSEFVVKEIFTKDEVHELVIADFDNKHFYTIKNNVQYVTIIDVGHITTID